MKNESKKQTENIDSSNKKLLLSDVSGMSLPKLIKELSKRQKLNYKYQKLIQKNSEEWDIIVSELEKRV